MHKIKRVCIYAYIYEGGKNWKNSKANATIYIPGQPRFSVELDTDEAQPMVAIAMLEVQDNQLDVLRLMTYHGRGHGPDAACSGRQSESKPPSRR